MTILKKENLQTLLAVHHRRLQKLKEQQAIQGINTPPETLTEIEDIEAEIARLQSQLDKFRSPAETQHPTAPLVHIYNWGKPPAQPPTLAAQFLDWYGPGKFEELPDKTRRVPAPETWHDELLPRLAALPGQTAGQGWIRLEGQCALSTGFAFGHFFHSKERYQIEVAQYVPDRGGTEYWATNAPVPEGVTAPAFAYQIARSETIANPLINKDAVIVVAALNRKSVAEILRNVGSYFGEPDDFSQIPDGVAQFATVKGVLVLEAEVATRENRALEGWEVAALAKSSTRLVNDFKNQLNPDRLHLFLAAPLGLAVFLGYHWLHVHKSVQCYEEVRTTKFYTPTCILNLP